MSSKKGRPSKQMSYEDFVKIYFPKHSDSLVKPKEDLQSDGRTLASRILRSLK